MTQREFFEMVIANKGITDEMIAHAQERIMALDKRNASRTSKPSKSQIANEPIKAQIVETLKGREPMLYKEVAEIIGCSAQKVQSLSKQIDGLVFGSKHIKGVGDRQTITVAE